MIERGQRLRISLTAKCPLRCTFCHGDGNTPPENHIKDTEVELNQVLQVVDLAAKRGFSTIRFTGGEPGSYRYFHQLLEKLPVLVQQYPIVKKWGLTTAGIPFLSKNRLEALISSAFTDIAVSIDSVEKGELSRPSSFIGVSGLTMFERVIEPLINEFKGFIKINTVFDGYTVRTKNVIRHARELGLNVTVLEANTVMDKTYNLKSEFRKLRDDIIEEFELQERHIDNLNETYLYDSNGKEIIKFYPDHCGAWECKICGDLEVRAIPVDGVLGIVPCYERAQGKTVPLFINGKIDDQQFDKGYRSVGLGPNWPHGTIG